MMPVAQEHTCLTVVGLALFNNKVNKVQTVLIVYS
jgi:hypothetical protein